MGRVYNLKEEKSKANQEAAGQSVSWDKAPMPGALMELGRTRKCGNVEGLLLGAAGTDPSPPAPCLPGWQNHCWYLAG